MHTFFHCWRRKAGCIALVMACVVMGEYARSQSCSDRLWVSLTPTRRLSLKSQSSVVAIEYRRESESYGLRPQAPMIDWSATAFEPANQQWTLGQPSYVENRWLSNDADFVSQGLGRTVRVPHLFIATHPYNTLTKVTKTLNK